MLSQSMYPVRVVNVVQLHLSISVVGCPLCFSKENYVQFVFIPMYRDMPKVFGHCNFLLYISYKTTIFENIIPK